MYCGKTGTPEAVKCEGCSSFFDKRFGLCPFCGRVYEENAEVPAIKGCVKEPDEKVTSEQTACVNDSVVVNPPKNNVGNPAVNTAVNNTVDFLGSMYKTAKSKNSLYNLGFLFAEMVCFIAAILVGWLSPWFNVEKSSRYLDLLPNVFSKDRIRYLSSMETPAKLLNESKYGVTVANGACVVAQILMILAIVVGVVYLGSCFLRDTDKRPKGALCMWLLILPSVLIELYRFSINSALEKAEELGISLANYYYFSSTHVWLIVVILAIAGRVFGVIYHKEV